MAKLRSLEEHNARIAEQYRKAGEPRPSGLACPSCGKELIYSSPAVMLATCPPSKHVHCVCGHTGTVLAQ